MNLSKYVEDFTHNPIHSYIVGAEGAKVVLRLDEKEIVVSDRILHIVALFLGLCFLRIWVEVGAALIKTGKVLITDDTEKIEELVEKLVGRRKRARIMQ